MAASPARAAENGATVPALISSGPTDTTEADMRTISVKGKDMQTATDLKIETGIVIVIVSGIASVIDTEIVADTLEMMTGTAIIGITDPIEIVGIETETTDTEMIGDVMIDVRTAIDDLLIRKTAVKIQETERSPIRHNRPRMSGTDGLSSCNN